MILENMFTLQKQCGRLMDNTCTLEQVYLSLALLCLETQGQNQKSKPWIELITRELNKVFSYNISIFFCDSLWQYDSDIMLKP